MNKTEFIEKVTKDSELSEYSVRLVIDTAMRIVRQEVIKGNPVRLPGFGVFDSVNRGARKARNPRTGEPIEVAPTRKIKFLPAWRFITDVQEAGLKPEIEPSLKNPTTQESESSTQESQATE